jgi:8-oxo-dGTP pyrophosphatase MutT (NUDIX family)
MPELKKRDGVSIVVIINKKKILLLKRRSLPFIINPGIWSFVSGGREAPEGYLETAYRELHEETQIKKTDLTLLQKVGKMKMFELRKPENVWSNEIFVFRTKTRKVKLNYENPKYRWASLNDLEKHRNYTNCFVDEKKLLKIIKRHLNK